MHAPPLQFVEQQSELRVHAFPSVVQVPPASRAQWWVPSQVPVQQSVFAAQAAPVVVHFVEHVPATQENEQHSVESVQLLPSVTQPPEKVHRPESQ